MKLTQLFLTGLLALAASVLVAQQQSFEGYIEAADKAASKDDFYNAYRLYEIATQFTDGRNYKERIPEVRYKAGVAAYQATAYGVAEQQLRGALELNATEEYPLIKYYLGQSIFRQGRYDEAVVTFQEFLEEQPGADPAYISSAQAQINDADWAIDAMSRAEELTLTHLPEGINTEDTEAMYVQGPKGQRYFTSNHFLWKGDTITPKRLLSRIMRRTGEDTAEPLPALINQKGKNVGHTAFDGKMEYVYYSVCEFVNYDELRCDLYRARVGEDGEWTDPQPLPLNVAGSTTTQPSVGLDANDGREYLFFASDRSGGQGGLDLYRAPIADDGTIGEIENLEFINTPADDATPFWYAPRQTLYFSTDGRFTFGGLDIYRSYWINGRFRRPINLGSPVNSSADEGYYTRFDDPDVAYVASRRPGAEALFYTGEREVCCYELYEFAPDPRIDLQALTFNELTQEELLGVTVALYELTPSGPELVRELTETETNEFNFRVDPGKKYRLVANKDGFSQDIDEFDLASPELKDLPFVERRLELAPAVVLDVFNFNNLDSAALDGATVELYRVGPDGELELVERRPEIDGNTTQFILPIGAAYVIKSTKPGFGEATAEVDLVDYKPDAPLRIRRDLYLGQSLVVYVIDGFTDESVNGATIQRLGPGGNVLDTKTNVASNDFYYTVNLGEPLVLNTGAEGYYSRTDTLSFNEQDLIDAGGQLVYYVPLFYNDPGKFLPFDVYFDNDYPNPRTLRTTTDRGYDETYEAYLERESLFREEYVSSLDSQQAFLEGGAMELFFDRQVKRGFRRLQAFAEALLVHARAGNSFNVGLRGYASPRAATYYNERLSARRNSSVKNYLRRYADGALLPYIENGQISFSELALGESTAAETINDRLDEPQKSVFSVVASQERKVELTRGIEQKK